MWTSRGRAFYAEATAGAKALRQDSQAASWKSKKVRMDEGEYSGEEKS